MLVKQFPKLFESGGKAISAAAFSFFAPLAANAVDVALKVAAAYELGEHILLKDRYRAGIEPHLAPELLGKRSVVPPEPKHQAPPKDTPYQRAKEAFKTKTFDPKEFKVVKADSLDYTVGDTVSHIKFGQGTVLEIQDGGRDFEVKVDFEKYGVKRMFASFAKLKKV